MRNIGIKQNLGGLPDSLQATKLGANEWNSVMQELENAPSRAGLTLAPPDGSGEDTTQLAQAMFINGVKATAFQDNGTANTYELTPISGLNGLKLPPDYSSLDGARVAFVAGNSNTGAATLNIGQSLGTLLGAKPIVRPDGAPLVANDILAGKRYEAFYDESGNRWVASDDVDFLRYNVSRVTEASFFTAPLALSIVGGIASPDLANRHVFTLAVNQALTLGFPVSIPGAGMAVIFATQDAIGGHTLTLAPGYRVIDGEWSAAANAVNIIWLVSDGSGTVLDIHIRQRGV